MAFKRGLAELTKEQRNSSYYRAVVQGRVIRNYVFSRTKYVCGGCGEVSISRFDFIYSMDYEVVVVRLTRR
jgi:hypothetical protein